MSQKDLRNFTDMMAKLGYRRLISLENFRTPNFSLVAELLYWLIRKVDKSCDLSLSYATKDERVSFVIRCAEIMACKTGVKLNLKRLYQADGYSVKEMLKIAVYLYIASKRQSNDSENTSSDDTFSTAFSVIKDLSNALDFSKDIASILTDKGSALFGTLEHELAWKEERYKQRNSLRDVKKLETEMRSVLQNLEREIDRVKESTNKIQNVESNLDSKIQRKEHDLDRTRKRLEAMKLIRPAYLEEYETLEFELDKLYREYVIKFKSNAYLRESMVHYLKKIYDDNADLIDVRKLEMQSYSEDESDVSTASPASVTDKKTDAPLKTDNKVIGRIRTATQKGKENEAKKIMYDEEILNDSDFDDSENLFNESSISDEITDGDTSIVNVATENSESKNESDEF